MMFPVWTSRAGKVLKDTETLGEAGVKENDFIVVMVTKVFFRALYGFSCLSAFDALTATVFRRVCRPRPTRPQHPRPSRPLPHQHPRWSRRPRLVRLPPRAPHLARAPPPLACSRRQATLWLAKRKSAPPWPS